MSPHGRYAFVLFLATTVAGCHPMPSQKTVAKLTGLSFPFEMELTCPGVRCDMGLWRACTTTEVHENPGMLEPIIAEIPEGDRFPVGGSALLVLKPGVVRVTRELHQRLAGTEHVYKPGETLLLLGHLGAGSFAIMRNGIHETTEAFWPSDDATGWPISGKLQREADTELWLRTSRNWILGWVRDGKTLVSPKDRTEPLRCPAS